MGGYCPKINFTGSVVFAWERRRRCKEFVLCQALWPDFGLLHGRYGLNDCKRCRYPVFRRNLKRRRIAALQRLLRNHKKEMVKNCI